MLARVGLHQQVVDEVDAEVEVLEAGELLGALGLRVPGPVDVDRVRDPRRAEQLVLGVGREDLLPGVMALHRRQVRAADEPLCLVVEAHLVRGARQPLHQRSQQRRRPTHPRSEPVGDVGVVAAEELVAPLAGEDDLDRVRGQLRHQVGGERRGVAERFVEGLDQAREQVDRVGAKDQLVVVGVVALGDKARQLQLAERLLLEPDREGAHPIAALGRRQGRQGGGVDAPRQQNADRHVRDEMCPDRVPQPAAELLGEGLVAFLAHLVGGHGSRSGVPGDLDLPPLRHQGVPGGQLSRLAEDR